MLWECWGPWLAQPEGCSETTCKVACPHSALRFQAASVQQLAQHILKLLTNGGWRVNSDLPIHRFIKRLRRPPASGDLAALKFQSPAVRPLPGLADTCSCSLFLSHTTDGKQLGPVTQRARLHGLVERAVFAVA